MAGYLFYSGVGEMDYNHHPVYTGSHACVSPIYGSTKQTKRKNRVSVPKGTKVIQDCGAFSDTPECRLSSEDALKRQREHAKEFGYEDDIEARADYDCLLIDEIWENGVRRKERWPEEAGEIAVKVSVEAARFMNDHRDGIPIIFSAQGVSPSQYVRCTEQIVPLLDPERDIFGLGGWCILGKLPRMLPIFQEAMHHVIPILGQSGIRRVHIWGVCYAPALGELLYLADQWGIQVSTDSVGASVRPTRGSWGYASWTNPRYKTAPILPSCKEGKCAPDVRCRGLERARHIDAVRDWLENFQEREPYHYKHVLPKKPKYTQTNMLDLIGA